MGDKPQIGWWYTNCCRLDMRQITDKAALEDVMEQLADPDHPLPPRVWPTKQAAMDVLWREDGLAPPQEGQE